jgi:hypothetical protein
MCCYTKLHPRTAQALGDYAQDAELIDVTGDPFAYWEAIKTRWNHDDDLVIVEHDNTFTAEQLRSFGDCPQPWCSFTYDPGGGLGFTRFRAALMQPGVIDEVQRDRFGAPIERVHWTGVADRIFVVLSRHRHYPHGHGRVPHFT